MMMIVFKAFNGDLFGDISVDEHFKEELWE